MARSFGLRSEIILSLCLLLGAAQLFSGLLLLRLTEQALIEERIETLVALLEGGQYARNGSDATETAQGQILHSTRLFVEALTKRFPIDQWLMVDKTFTLYDFLQGDSISFHLDPDHFDKVRVSGKAAVEKIEGELARSGTTVLVTVPLFAGNVFAGAVQVRAAFDDVGPRLAAFRQTLLIYLLITGAILVAFGFFLLGRTIIRPIRALAEATRKVADGQLETTLDVSAPAEIATLAETFNAMTASLRGSREEALAHIKALEYSNWQLQQAQGELVRSEKFASVGRLSAGMAHEIGNPLSAIIGYLEFLRTEPVVSGEIIDHALAEARRIDRLVRDLLDYATPEQAPPEPIDPITALDEARRLLENQGAFESATLLTLLPAALSPIRVSRHRLLQVAVNLLLNARDAAPVGTIVLEAGEDAAGIWFSVSDDGEGIDEETAAKIFDPFFTTKEPGKGRGLGLTVCHQIVDAAGGAIEIKSAVGEGTTFLVRFTNARGAP